MIKLSQLFSTAEPVSKRLACFGVALLSLLGQQTFAAAHETSQIQEATPVDRLRLAEGFSAELLYSVPTAEQGSWVSMCVDDQGRLITSDQYGKLYRVTTPAADDRDGDVSVETLDLELGMAQGLLYAFDSLYVVVNGSAGEGAGLYRVLDSNGDDTFDEVRLLRRFEGGGEHGPHAVILSPDQQSLFICGGNHTNIPDPETSLVPRNWDEDQLLERMWDAGGHAVGKLAPGGWICRTDPEGTSFELVSAGYRNEYDIAFNSAGDLFTYDADMEWDVGSPWYRPTRICHATAGSEFGWRSGTGKWPVSYPDSLPPVVDIGPGSPTGIAFGYGAKFPAKYQNALFIADWSYGIIYAVHLEADGASYSGTFEQFCSAAALQVADIVVNPKDGALYFVIGGRRTQSGLYRVQYEGSDSTEPAPAITHNALAQLRLDLESRFGSEESEDLDFAWEHLGHEDRHIAYAARMVVEHMPIRLWAERALQTSDPMTRLNATIALARNGDESHLAGAIDGLARIDWSSLDQGQRIALLRAYGLCIIRLGDLEGTSRQQVLTQLAAEYPSGAADLDRELCRLLVRLEAPGVVEKTLELLAAAPTQEEQIHYALCLRVASEGWNLERRRAYFEWFNQAAALRGGNSFNGFLANIRNAAIDRLRDEERAPLQGVINAIPEPVDVIGQLRSRPLVQEWSVSDLLDSVEERLVDRDFEQGRRIFSEAACFKCHRFDGQGGIVGPDLTGAGRRFNELNLLEALVEPSKVVSDQYQATSFLTDDGRQFTGRIVNLNGETYMIQEDMLNPGRLTRINRNTIEEMRASSVSMMPAGLLDTFTEEEILDLVAYIRSGGDPEGEAFKKKVTNEQARNQPPNVLMIISDDQAWNDYSFMGHEVVQTPNLDRLARESVTFRRGYVPTALCRPSLATLATGLYPSQHGVIGNDPAIPSGLRGNPRQNADYMAECERLIESFREHPSLPQLLAEAGYVSLQTGKWWEGAPQQSGFTEAMTHGDPARGGRHGDQGLKIGREGLDEIFDFIDRHHNESSQDPFFIWYAPFLPHTPHNPPQRLLDRYQNDQTPIELAKYYAMCDWFDESCGTLLDGFDERGLSDNTLVIYVTDNGWIQRTSESETPEGWRRSYAPRSKQSANEGGIRTPIMLRWPARFGPIDDDQTLINSIDLVPTILAACGVEIPDSLPGENLLPVCHGRPLSRQTIFGEGFAHDIADIDEPNASLLYRWCISGKWKLLTFHEGRIGRYQLTHQLDDRSPQLYDLQADPFEEQDLADQYPDVVARLQRLLASEDAP